MEKTFWAILIFLAFLILTPVVFGQIEAASFQFDPTSATSAVGQTLSIKVNIAAGTDQLSGADAYVLYDSTYLKAQSVTAGTYFPTVTNDITTAGKIYIAGMVDDPATSASGSGTLATIVFQAVTDGQATLTIDCTTSKIVKDDINATNVMQCSQNGQATVTVGTGSSGYMTTPGPTPSVLPKSGIFDNVVKFAVPGVLLFLVGAVTRLLLLL